MSYYDILGVSDSATPEQIKRAYRDKATVLHPDKGGNALEFAEVATAYKVLIDPASREHYDKTGTDGRLPLDLVVQNMILATFNESLQFIDDGILRRARDKFNKLLAELRQNRETTLEQKKVLKSKRRKIRSKSEVNYFHLVVDQNIKNLDEHLTELEYQEKAYKTCLKTLQSYSEPRPKQAKEPTYSIYRFASVRIR